MASVVEVVVEGVPPGLGAPIYGKLDSDLAAALMGINDVKGVEIGAGFHTAKLSGEENPDEMRRANDGTLHFLSNQAGGISTGQPIVCRFAVKPTSSILTPRRAADRYGRETEIVTKGRHDPCVGIRAVQIGEAMVACVITDHYLRQVRQAGRPHLRRQPRQSIPTSHSPHQRQTNPVSRTSDIVSRLGSRSSDGMSGVGTSVPSAGGTRSNGACARLMNSRCAQDEW